MNSLPAAAIAMGCLLIILLLVVSILYVLKAREVTTLKKTVFELRDTMRMMRYEEASLSRMLHTASKPAEQVVTEESRTAEKENSKAPIATPIVEEPVVEEPHAEATEEEEFIAKEAMTEESTIEETVTEETVVENITFPTEEKITEEEIEVPAATKVKEELFTDNEAVTNEGTTEKTTVEEIEIAAEEVEKIETPIEEEEPNTVVPSTHEKSCSAAPAPQKQPIHERRPAIPTDLFSAWFAEHEESPAEAEAFDELITEEVLAEQPQIWKEASQTTPQKPLLTSTEEVPTVTDTNEAASVAEETETPSPESEAIESTPETELSKEDERFLRKFERVVNTRMRNPNLNVDTIAAQFGIGRTNFYRKVREVTGISPNDYLRKCRMERAAEMLRTTELSISDVCAQVGVPDAQYFSKVFKVYFETTPTAYREKHQSIQ